MHELPGRHVVAVRVPVAILELVEEKPLRVLRDEGIERVEQRDSVLGAEARELAIQPGVIEAEAGKLPLGPPPVLGIDLDGGGHVEDHELRARRPCEPLRLEDHAARDPPGLLPDLVVSRAVELRRSKLRTEVREKRPAEDHVGILVLGGAGQQRGEASLEGVPDLRGLEEAEHRSQCSRTPRAHRIREAQDVFAEHSDDAAVVAESQATLHQGDREGDRCQRQPGVLENLRHGGEIFTTADRRAGGPIGSRRPERILLRSSIVPCFEAAEFYLRAFEFQKSETQIHRNSPTMYVESDLIKLEPGFRRQRRKKEFGVAGSINSLHHRQSEFEIAKGDWTRVLVLGGSFTFGWGVEAEQSYSHLLEGHLDGASSRKIEVINTGYTAGTCSDAHYLRRSAWSVDIRILGELGQGVRPRRGSMESSNDW